MSADGSWIEPIRQKHFGLPLAGTYPIERLARKEYWELHESAMRPHFPPEYFINLQGLLDDDERRGRDRLEAMQGDNPVDGYWVARHGEDIVAMFCGQQKDIDTYRMAHTHVHPDYRRRGLYTEIVQRMLGYSREAGFSAVISEHAPCNNAVIIAKLKAGFRIYGMDLDPCAGVSVLLKYFHNPAHLRAYQFRCGLATLDEQILANGSGAMPLLIEQIRRGAPPEQ